MVQISRDFPGRLLLATFLLLGLAPSLQAADIRVPEDLPSIKAALISAGTGDHVKIAPGHYMERGLIVPPGVTISGLGDSPADVVLDGDGTNRIMLCQSLGAATIIQNLTFQNGLASGSSSYDQNGGAILLNHATPIIRNCVFIDNYAESHGGAIRCSNSSPQIFNCEFRNNHAPNGGGGALDCSYDSHPVVVGCTFDANFSRWGGGLSCRAESSPSLYDCVFVGNEAGGDLGFGGAFMVDFSAAPIFQRCTFYANIARYGGAGASFMGSRPRLLECTVVGNEASFMGGGLICSRSAPSIQNSIIAFNIGAGLPGGNGAVPTVSCSNIFGNTGGDWIGAIAPQREIDGNLSVDPLFCDYPPSNGIHFNLMPDSPCTEGNNSCSLMGAWVSGCGISPVMLQDFEIQWNDSLAEIRWNVPDEESDADEFQLVRTTVNTEGSDTPIPFRETSNGSYLGQDTEVQPVDGHQYDYHLYQRQYNGTMALLSSLRLDTTTLPLAWHLHGVHPNPFNPSTRIRLRFNQERQVKVTINDIAGRRIMRLAEQTFAPGEHMLTWDGRDATGRACQSGTYLVLVEVDGRLETQKVTLLK